MVSIIVAMAQNNTIGKDNKLLWSIPEDMRHFKEHTFSHPVIMGRKTFESIRMPLPNRTNIVLTRDKNYTHEGIITFNSLEAALKEFKTSNLYIIGGEQVYKEALEKELVDKVYLTVVFRDFEGDTFFPDLDKDKWEKTHSTIAQRSKKQDLTYAFYTFERI